MAGARSGTSLFFFLILFLPISAAAAAASRDCSLGNASAAGDGFRNLTAGFAISDQPLNRTYRNDSFTVVLSQNDTLHQIGVIAVWDAPTFSNFGHVFLNANPTPTPERSDLYPKQASDQPTMFQNCKALSLEFRLR